MINFQAKYTRNSYIEKSWRNSRIERKKSKKTVNMASTHFNASTTRYQFDEFKNSKACSVPFEKMDYSIYRPSSNCVAFTTTEERITTWIKVFYQRYHVQQNNHGEQGPLKSTWEEQQAQNDPNKCEKITLTLHLEGKKPQESIVTIIIYCSTGRIQIQGRFLRKWGDNEFDMIKKIIDKK